MLAPWKNSYDNPTQCIKKLIHHFANNGSKLWFSSSYSWMCELDDEGWVPKNWCFWTVVLEKTLESPLNSKEIKPVNLKGDQPWILVRRTDAEAEGPLYWSSDVNSRLTGKVSDAGEDWGQKEKTVTENEIAGRHHQCNWHKFGQTSGDSEGQQGLACCNPWERPRQWVEADHQD